MALTDKMLIMVSPEEKKKIFETADLAGFDNASAYVRKRLREAMDRDRAEARREAGRHH